MPVHKPSGGTLAKSVLTYLMMTAWCVLMISLIATGIIQTNALSQPKSPDFPYLHPQNVKGTIRYLTSGQARILSITMPGIWGSLAVVFSLAVPYEWLKRREEKRRIQRLLGDE
jgi:hypothetical protein